MPEIHLGLNPTRKRTQAAKSWRDIAFKMILQPDHSTNDLGCFLSESLAVYTDKEEVTIRVDDYHAKLIYDAMQQSKKGKVKA